LHAISRHGLLPLAQSTPRNTVLSGSDVPLQQEAHSLRKLTRTVISLAAAVEEAGGEWHEVVALLRPLSPTIWAALADTERRRFLRHVQPYWDIHRHCLPAFIAEHLQELRQSGQLQITAGRIEWLQTSGEQIRVAWRPRGDAAIQEATFDGVINAIGPDYRLRTARDPLLRSLFESGIVTADPHSLGIRTDAHCAVIGVNDQPHPHLYYLGPMLRAAHWEATAVPELRGHAERLAAQLAARQQQWATQ
jgi:uncharacterized NAD(P)/FAD-binding protein YdhS